MAAVVVVAAIVMPLPAESAHAAAPTFTPLGVPDTDTAVVQVPLAAEVFAAPDPSAPGDESAVLTSPPEATPDFDVVGVTWDDASAPVEGVQVRTRTDGVWSEWVELEVDRTAPDPGTTEALHARPGTEPFIQPGADGVQVRVDTADGQVPDDLSATLVDGGAAAVTPSAVASGATALAASAEAVDPALAAGVPGLPPDALRPAIVTRAQWGADESIRKPIDWNSTIKGVVVHHTVNANDYTAAQAPALVRGIYAYHVKGRGWSDIGYHFLVDRFGTVYEGRKGSIEAIPLGVHTGGFNTNTIGIAMIGNYQSSVLPSDAAVRSVARVAAWKLGTYARDPLGTFTATAGPGSTHPVRVPGWTGAVSVISGHRDLAATACPGTTLYARLGDIRALVAGDLATLRATSATIDAPYGGTVAASFYAATDTPWQAVVAPLCDATGPIRSLTGHGIRTVPVSWNQKTDAGAQAPPGFYTITVTRSVNGKVLTDSVATEVLPPPGNGTSSCGVSRYGGAERAATAVEIGRAAFPSSTAVVIVTGDQQSVVDGLVAAPFARSKGAPVLIASRDGIPAVTADEIRRRGATSAWVIGGTGVLGPAVVDDLRALGVTAVTRLSGPDRQSTAEAVAAQMPASTRAFVTSGSQANLIDAAAVSGVASATGAPILLATPSGLTDASAALLQSRGVTATTVVGAAPTVPDAVLQQVRSATGGTAVRYGGADRYATALAVATAFAPTVGAQRVLIANSSNRSLIDSLAGGTLGRVTLLIPGATSFPAVNAWLQAHGTTRLDLAGGPGVVQTTAALELVEATR